MGKLGKSSILTSTSISEAANFSLALTSFLPVLVTKLSHAKNIKRSKKNTERNQPSLQVSLQPLQQEQWEIISCVSFICALSQVQLLLLKCKTEKEVARLRPVPPSNMCWKKWNSPRGRGADRKRKGIDFTLTLAQQPGSFNRGGTWQLATKCLREPSMVIEWLAMLLVDQWRAGFDLQHKQILRFLKGVNHSSVMLQVIQTWLDAHAYVLYI